MTDVPDSTPDYDTEKADKYFTCQCNPPFIADRGEAGLFAHRIPIDCMTAEDWQRVARAKQERATQVWVVSVEGDQDCGYANDGAIGVFANISDAWGLASSAADAFIENRRDWDPDPYYKVDDEGIHLERGSYLVKEFNVG